MSDWRNRDFYQLFLEWRKQRDFLIRQWYDAKSIKHKPTESNGGVMGNVNKSYKNKDPGIYTLKNVFNSKSDPGSGGGSSFSNTLWHTFMPVVSRDDFNGPTGAMMAVAYPNAPVVITEGAHRGKQRWTVPATGTYRFELGGAGGGDGSTGYAGNSSLLTYGVCHGAQIIFDVVLTAGHQIEIAVGVQGGSSGGAHGNENGGGGGTWVYNYTTSTLLGVAGGGGGLPSSPYGNNCTKNITTWQQGCGSDLEVPDYTNCNSAPAVPTAGYGGTTAGSYMGGAGGGYLSNGANGGTHCSTAIGGQSWGNGLVGGAGNTCYNSASMGGFGGGGGGQLGGPGGGGGYTGGRSSAAWSSFSNFGGGGGSYVNETAGCIVVSKTRGGNTGTKGGAAEMGYCEVYR